MKRQMLLLNINRYLTQGKLGVISSFCHGFFSAILKFYQKGLCHPDIFNDDGTLLSVNESGLKTKAEKR